MEVDIDTSSEGRGYTCNILCGDICVTRNDRATPASWARDTNHLQLRVKNIIHSYSTVRSRKLLSDV